MNIGIKPEQQPQTETDHEKGSRYFAQHAPLLLQQAAKLLEQRLQQNPQNGK